MLSASEAERARYNLPNFPPIYIKARDEFSKNIRYDGCGCFFLFYLTPQTKAADHLRPKRNVLSKTENRELSQKQGSKKH